MRTLPSCLPASTILSHSASGPELALDALDASFFDGAGAGALGAAHAVIAIRLPRSTVGIVRESFIDAISWRISEVVEGSRVVIQDLASGLVAHRALLAKRLERKDL